MLIWFWNNEYSSHDFQQCISYGEPEANFKLPMFVGKDKGQQKYVKMWLFQFWSNCLFSAFFNGNYLLPNRDTDTHIRRSMSFSCKLSCTISSLLNVQYVLIVKFSTNERPSSKILMKIFFLTWKKVHQITAWLIFILTTSNFGKQIFLESKILGY